LYLATSNTDDVINGQGHVTVFTVNANGTLSNGTNYIMPYVGNYPYSVPIALAYTLDGSFLVVANQQANNIAVFTVGAGGELLNDTALYDLPSGTEGPSSVSFSPNGLYLATANYLTTSVTIFAVGSGVLSSGTSYKLTDNSGNPSGASPVAAVFSPNGDYLATANTDGGVAGGGDVSVFNVGAGGILSGEKDYALASGSLGPVSLAFSQDSSYLVVANLASDDFNVFQVGTGGVLSGATAYSTSAGTYSAAFSPNGLYVATTSFDSATTYSGVMIFEWDCNSKQPSNAQRNLQNPAIALLLVLICCSISLLQSWA